MNLIIALSLSLLATNSLKGWMEHSRAAQAYKKQDYGTARALYESRLAEYPHDIQALHNLGKTVYRQNDFSNAERCFEKVLSTTKLTAEQEEQVHFELGDVYGQLKKYTQALEQYQQVLAHNPKHEHAPKRIAYIKQLLEEQKQQKSKDQEPSKQDPKQDKGQQEQQDKQNQKSGEQDKTGKKSAADQQQQPSSSPENRQKTAEENQKKSPNAQASDSAVYKDTKEQRTQQQAKKQAVHKSTQQSKLNAQEQHYLEAIQADDKQTYKRLLNAELAQRGESYYDQTPYNW